MSESLMSAEESEPESLQTGRKPVVSQAILAWMEREGCPEIFAPDQELPAETPENAPPASSEVEPESDDTLSNLLQAIQGTDIAAELRGTSPPGGLFALPVKIGNEVPAADPQPKEAAPVKPARAKARRPRSSSRPRKSSSSAAEVADDATPSEALNPLPCVASEAARPSADHTTPQVAIPKANSSGVPLGTSEAPDWLLAPKSLPVFFAPMLPVLAPKAATEHSHSPAPTSTEILDHAAATAGTPSLPATGATMPALRERPIENESPVAPPPDAREGETEPLSALGAAAERLSRAGRQFSTWIESLFEPPDPRRSKRLAVPPLVAYHWTAESPQAHPIANISASGLYLLTEERWPVGGCISMTLQRTDKERGSRGSWIAVEFMVVRWCKDGLAGAFLPFQPGGSNAVMGMAENCADEKTLEQFVKRLGSASRSSRQR